MNTKELSKSLRAMEFGDVSELDVDTIMEAADVIDAMAKHLGMADAVIDQWKEAHKKNIETIVSLEAMLTAEQKRNRKNESRIILPH